MRKGLVVIIYTQNYFMIKKTTPDFRKILWVLLIAAFGQSAAYAGFRLQPDTTGLPNTVVVAAQLTEFKGSIKNNSKAELSWIIFENDQLNKIYLQRSADGVNYTSVATIKANLSANNKAYQFVDGISGLTGNKLFYRLVLVDNDNKLKTSNVLMLSVKNYSTSLQLNPNPAISFTQVSFSMEAKGTGELQLINSHGKTILTKTIQYAEGNVTITLGALDSITKGIYTIMFQTNGKILSEQLVIHN
ncbi:MAG: T9SS C-terminal target domain-containing protein [Sphingobacteriales bacterium]|nr:MAG: T9SS C-terminal target domain-containing protein [Sphingobacteriales bacterium]